MTLEEIGKVLGRTRERVRQIEAGALRSLMRALERRGLLATGAAEAMKQVHRVVTELRT
jgi:DNA-directed RNA polymerase sigma subunit (sigma70/sigma32)